jgi:hypothetical protein
MNAQKNVTYLFPVADVAVLNGANPTVARTLGIRRRGELLCDNTALVAGDWFQFLYMDASTHLVTSPMLAWSNLISNTIQAPSALASQVSTIGYNGTDGDIVATNSGNYLVTIGFRDSLKMIGNKRLFKYGEYQALATAHNHDIAIGLADNLEKNLSKDAFKRVVVEVLCSAAYDADHHYDSTVTVVNGQQTIAVTNLLYHTGSTLAVGDYLRFNAVVGTPPPAITDSVYRVTAITGTTVVTLDRPLTCQTGAYHEAGPDLQVIAKADAEAAGVKWGIRLTGNDTDAPFELGKFGNNLIFFSVGASSDFSTTEVRLGTTPKIGYGTYKALAQLDWELQANRKEAYRIAEYPLSFTSNALSTETISNVRVLRFKDNSTEAIGSSVDSFIEIIITYLAGNDAAMVTLFTV